MKEQIDIEPELKSRIDLVAKRTGALSSEILADALENGHSLARNISRGKISRRPIGWSII